MSTLGAIIAHHLHPDAINLLQQLVRQRGGTYADFMAEVRRAFEREGVAYPGDGTIEDILLKLDEDTGGDASTTAKDAIAEARGAKP